jgi:5-methylthioribose kinase
MTMLSESSLEVPELSRETAIEHLRRRGLTAATEVGFDELGGGVSNIVLRYAPTPDGSPGSPGVLKQPRRRLRVPFEWICPLERVLKEVQCLEILACSLEPGTVPTVLDYDPDRYILAMSCAPEGARAWKGDLLAGILDPAVADEAGSVLRQVHAVACPPERNSAALDDPRMLVPLRIDPYYRPAAAANPDVADQVLAAGDRLTSARDTLVLGDYVPKNILVAPDGRLTIIDFEVAHYGDPAYDTASLLNHLLLKALAVPGRRRGLAELARVFWAAYKRAGGPATDDGTLLQLGALQLARVDGLSPVEYLNDSSRAEARAFAHSVLQRRVDSVEDAIGLVEEAA